MERRSFVGSGLAGVAAVLAATTSGATPLQFVPTASKEKWAVIFGTWCGTARDAAVWISEGLGGLAAVFDVRHVPDDLGSYDHLIVGTAIRGGRGRKELEAYLEAHGARLSGKIRGLFACCGNLGQPPGPKQTKDYIDDYLAKLCGVGPLPSRVFGGRITKAVTAPEDYKVVVDLYQRLKMTLADYDNLSRPECLRLGAEILARKS